MGSENVRSGFAGRGEQHPEVADGLIDGMWLGNRSRNVVPVDPRPRPVIRTYARKAGNGRKHGRLALSENTLACSNQIVTGLVRRISGVEDFTPQSRPVAFA